MKNLIKRSMAAVTLACVPLLAFAESADAMFEKMNSNIKSQGRNIFDILFYVALLIGGIVLIPQIVKLFGDRSEEAQKGLLSTLLVVLLVIGFLGILKAFFGA